jgi:hypothetical protein
MFFLSIPQVLAHALSPIFMAFFLPNTKSPERSAVKHPAPFHIFGFSNAPCRIDALQPAFKLFLRITRNLAQENTEISNSKY